MDPLRALVAALHERSVRFVVIGVGGANYWAHSASVIFATRDRDLFLPLDADNLLRSWQASEAVGLELWSGREPLDSPRDLWLAERVVGRRAAVRATDNRDLEIDLTLVMGSFDFDTVWNDRRVFSLEGVDIPVARLRHIVTSKHQAGRDKDRLFLATHRQELETLLEQEDKTPPKS